MSDNRPSKEHCEFERGYICAVAEIIRMHDEPVIAKDVLRGIGRVDWSLIDEYDRTTLRGAGLIK